VPATLLALGADEGFPQLLFDGGHFSSSFLSSPGAHGVSNFADQMSADMQLRKQRRLHADVGQNCYQI
jgi:hypothetical protein